MTSPYNAYANGPPASQPPYASAGYRPSPHPYPPPDASVSSLSSESAGEHYKLNTLPSGARAPAYPAYPQHQTYANVDVHRVSRTPSPTPSEAAELKKTSVIDWAAMAKWSFWFRKEWGWYYVAFIIGTVGVILFTVYHTTIVHWLRPAADWMHDLPFGYLIPIAVLFVISFPPLFGHEIVAILCGLVWGLGIGFAIVAVGTFIGEMGNYYAFKYCCRARAEKLERTKLTYGCLARVVREGGFKIALAARLSAIPGHFTTAVFSTCGMGVWTFALAAILSLPKQFITVYLGVALEQSEDGQASSTKDKIIKNSVLIVTGIVTIGAMWYIYHEMNKVKAAVIYDRRKARQGKLEYAPHSTQSTLVAHPHAMDSTAALAPNASSAELPLPYASKPAYVAAPRPQRADATQPPVFAQPHSPPPPGLHHRAPQMAERTDPFADSAAARSYQRTGPPRGYGSPPPDTFARANNNNNNNPYARAHPPTGDHRRYASPPAVSPPPSNARGYASPPPNARGYASPPPNANARGYASPPARHTSPPTENAHNPFSDPPPPDYYHHGAEASDATFYTAAAHSREPTEARR